MSEPYEGPPITTGGGLEDATEAHGGWSRWVDMADALHGRVPMPEVFSRSDGRFTFYRGQVNAVIGESESGKSLLVQAACMQVLEAGGHVVYFDHESDAVSVSARMVALGATTDALEGRFHYMNPEGRLTPAEWEVLGEALATIGPDLIAVDGLTAAMEAQGLEVNSNRDAATIFRTYLNPLTECDAAVATVHHVTKGGVRGQNTHGLGAGTLKNLLGGAMYEVDTEEKNRHAPGRFGSSRVTIQKDRAGGVRMFAAKKVWATFATTSKPTGEDDEHGRPLFTTEWALRVPGEGLEDGPTGCMEAVSRYLEAEGGNVTTTAIYGADLGAGFGKDTRKWALQVLEGGGFATSTTGPRNAVLWTSAAPYRAPADDAGEVDL
jgi:energy-coupling factor transporter ATP-binding protein EcfA2